jgi:hypothetical protein
MSEQVCSQTESAATGSTDPRASSPACKGTGYSAEGGAAARLRSCSTQMWRKHVRTVQSSDEDSLPLAGIVTVVIGS